MPLSMLKVGDTAVVSAIKGNEGIKKHLENLGFVANAQITVVSVNGGDMIVKVMESKIALGKDMTTKIIVTPQ
ncbi:FeoA domain protein [[Eubacterium] yurii subsp. margaretiae ATCC 43715]|jgi:ferrous iron transport protein A|nr:FeoA domain protein [[Eubacterium] yurii subsp. margaretiae ATCC 43715]RKW48334.1 MAG: ferrous iron transport protein A [Lachnospiraceae bacterium]SKC62065.1 ferrous iron transport protein A [[Eubacterium] yurii]